MIQGSLLMLWMDENASQQSNKKSLMTENLQLLSEITTKLARTASAWQIKAGVLNRCSMLEIRMYFYLFFSFYESKMDQN